MAESVARRNVSYLELRTAVGSVGPMHSAHPQ